jgi:hypothetical protein
VVPKLKRQISNKTIISKTGVFSTEVLKLQSNFRRVQADDGGDAVA